MAHKFLRLVRANEHKSLSTLAIVLVILFLLACKCGDLGKNNRNNSNNSNNSGETAEDNGDFKVVNVPVTDGKYADLDRVVKEQKMLENAADDLNTKLTLPWDITMTAKVCGQINAFYNPNDRSITICYEFMELFQRLYVEQGDSQQVANQKMFDATTFIFCHELGHALINAYKLPVTGREEDVADQVATYISSEEMGESGERAAIAGAVGFLLLSQKRGSGVDDTQFADEHSMDKQRYYNIVCWLYGHDPNKYQNLVQDGTLPPARAQRCPSEYQQFSEALKTQLAKYRKNK